MMAVITSDSLQPGATVRGVHTDLGQLIIRPHWANQGMLEMEHLLHSNHYCNTVHVRYSTSIYSFCLSKLVIISMLSQWLPSSPVCSAVMGLLLLPVVASINGRSWISLAQLGSQQQSVGPAHHCCSHRSWSRGSSSS